MLRMTNQNNQPDYQRKYKASVNFGLKIGQNNKPIQIDMAYASTQVPIIYFFAHKLDDTNRIIETYELSTDTLIYVSGQWKVDSAKFFDNITPTNVLGDGNYFLSFSDGVNTWASEAFSIYQKYVDGSETYAAPKVKYFENDPIFIFND